MDLMTLFYVISKHTHPDRIFNPRPIETDTQEIGYSDATATRDQNLKLISFLLIIDFIQTSKHPSLILSWFNLDIFLYL